MYIKIKLLLRPDLCFDKFIKNILQFKCCWLHVYIVCQTWSQGILRIQLWWLPLKSLSPVGKTYAICDVRLTMICWNSCTCYSSKAKGKLTSIWVVWKGFKEWFEKSAPRRKWTEHSRKGNKLCPETGKLSVDLKTEKGIGWGYRTDSSP